MFEVIAYGENGKVLHREKPLTIPAKRSSSTSLPLYEKIFDSSVVASWPSYHIQATLFTRDAESPINPIEGSESLMNNYHELFVNRNTTADISVKAADEVEIRVHKLILTTRSSVFKTMFDIEMTEKERSEIVIKDFDSQVLDELFKFMYCGKIELNEETIIELLRAAKRYEVADLPEICAKFIIIHFCDVDIWNCLEIAHKFELQELFEFIATLFFV